MSICKAVVIGLGLTITAACSDNTPQFSTHRELVANVKTYTKPLCATRSLDAGHLSDSDIGRFWPNDHMLVLEQAADVVRIKFTNDAMSKGRECWVKANDLQHVVDGSYSPDND